MQKHYFTIVLLFIAMFSQAQSDRQLSVSMNRSHHGTGDLRGVYFHFEYGKYVRSRLELSGSLAGTAHGGQFKVLVTDASGTRDQSFRYASGGVQLGGLARFAFVRNARHELALGAGPIVRYQISTLPDVYSFYLPTAQVPEARFSFLHYEDPNQLTAGYQAQFTYAYTLRRGVLLGVQAGYQNDANGDVITYYGLKVGKRFSIRKGT